jgi:hypothetical protein
MGCVVGYGQQNTVPGFSSLGVNLTMIFLYSKEPNLLHETPKAKPSAAALSSQIKKLKYEIPAKIFH